MKERGLQDWPVGLAYRVASNKSWRQRGARGRGGQHKGRGRDDKE